MALPLVVAQASGDAGMGWFILGGALLILAVGLAFVLMARRTRSDSLEARIAVREEADRARSDPAHPGPDPTPTPAPQRPAPAVPTFIDLPAQESLGHIDVQTHRSSTRRRSPLARPTGKEPIPETFIDLEPDPPTDPLIDLTEESVDLREQREDAKRGDPWS